MQEEELERHPFAMVLIPVFYGYLATISLFGFSDPYVLFSVVLPISVSMSVVILETGILLFLTIGLFKRQKVARSVLIGYNLFKIADTLITLILIDKVKLMILLKVDAAGLEEQVGINLFFCFIWFIILRYIKSHKDFFTK